MGTRSLVHVKENSRSKPILTLYRQYDGYPSGMGKDIKDALNQGLAQVVNGFSGNMESPEYFNGMGCLAAYLTSRLKIRESHREDREIESIGNVYIQKPGAKDCGEEFTYTLYLNENDKLIISVKDSYSNKILYKGELSKFNPDKYE